MAKRDITATRLREILSYAPDTGEFRWRVRHGLRIVVGSLAGNTNCRYAYIQISGAKYLSHRLAWLYVHGQWPKNEIDHINGKAQDNRIANLRDVTRKINAQNVHRSRTNPDATSIGVKRHKKHFETSVHVDGKTVYVGSFSTEKAANEAYIAAKRRLHEGCTL